VNNSITCFFPIETKVRDLDSRLLTALELIDNNINCFIGSKVEVFNNLKNYSAPIIFDKGLSNDDFLYNDLNKIGVQFVVMGEENGLFDEKAFYPNLISQYPEKVAPFCNASFEWGDIQKKWLSNYFYQKYKLKNYNFITTGNPRFDLLKDEFKFFFENKTIQLRKKYKNYILINTNFTIANDIRGGSGFIFHNSKKGNYLLNKYFKQLLNSYIEMVKYLSKNISNVNIVLRPHPTEGREIYLNAFKNLKNVFVDDCTRNVHELIIASELIIHHDCTTAIETYLANKKIISYQPIQNDLKKYFDKSYLHQTLPINLSHIVEKKEDLLNLIKNKNEITKPVKDKNTNIEGWIANSKRNKFAYIEIAKYIKNNCSIFYNYYQKQKSSNLKLFNKYNVNSLNNKIKRNINFFIYFDRTFTSGMGIKLKLKLILRDLIIPIVSKFFTKKKSAGHKKIQNISLDEIEKSISIFSTINKEYSSIKVKQVCKNGFFIYKSNNK
tara:strand:+ start:14244 stop:15731 length:1488 start_codon:yes stop_codon:yes gene_type:complete